MLYVSYYIARHISQINQMISAHFVYKQIVLMRRATCSLFAAWDMLETKLNYSEPDEHSALRSKMGGEVVLQYSFIVYV